MRVAIVGLGHLGSVTAACLADLGHEIIGIDRDRARVAAINRGQSPVDQAGLARLIRAARRKGRISAVDRISPAVLDCGLILVCVDTPRTAKRTLRVNGILQVCKKLREVGRQSKHVPLIVIRSTLPPGAFDSALARFCSPRGKLRMAYNPDFSREGNAVVDFMTPLRIVIGVHHRGDAHKVRRLYQSLKAPTFVTSWSNAEILKCADNAFHALKVTFANEIGSICESFGADGKKVMTLLCADRRLNISPAYLKPGLPFGGPCLTKDVEALASGARQHAISAPLLQAISESNRQHFERIIRAVKTRYRSVGFLGLSHKAGVGDNRGSHLFALAERLYAEGLDVTAIDRRLSKQEISCGSRRLTFLSPGRASRDVVKRFDIVFAPGKISSAKD